MNVITTRKTNHEGKQKIRRSTAWKKFRLQKFKEQSGLDYVTHRKLTSRATVHHLELTDDLERYGDLTDSSKFVMIGLTMHEVIHFLYRYFEKDEEIINRLVDVLKRMKELNRSE